MKNPILKAIITGAINGIPLIKKSVQEARAENKTEIPIPLATKVTAWISGKIAETLVVAAMAVGLLWVMKIAGITIDDVMQLIGILSPSSPQ